MHQESDNSGKPSFIFGHHFGLIGALVGKTNALFCAPLTGTIQDGDKIIRG